MDNLDTSRHAEDQRAEGRRKNRSRDHSWARNKPSATTGRNHIRMDTRIRANIHKASPSQNRSPTPNHPNPDLANPNLVLPNRVRPNRVRPSPGRRGSRFHESRGRTLHREILFLRGTRCHETRCRRRSPFRPGGRSRR